MAYDPFRRGPFPAGVQTLHLVDEDRDRRCLPVEVWYPATDAHRGQDLADGTRDTYELVPGFPAQPQDAVRDAAPQPGHHPVVVFSHGYGSHRRQSTFLCTHLASHGYVVASADHVGNTVRDLLESMMSGRRADAGATMGASVAARPADVSFVIDRLLDGTAGALSALLDGERIGMAGHSFGGWTTLAVPARDTRIRAALALAPAGGENPLGINVLGERLDFTWGRDVPTLLVAADQDNVLPLPGMIALHARIPGSKRMVVVQDADHVHFCDDVERVHELFRLVPTDPLFAPVRAKIRPIEELCPGAHAHDVVRGLGLAHMDAVLRGDEEAAALLGGDVQATMAARGIRVELR